MGRKPINSPDLRKTPFKIECGERLRLTRLALGFEEAQPFAELMGQLRSNLYTWESGVALVPPDFMVKLHDRFRIGCNWMYLGDLSDMPTNVRQDLVVLKKRLELGVVPAADEDSESRRTSK